MGVSVVSSDDDVGRLLAEEPFAFLALAAESISNRVESSIPELLTALDRLSTVESRALATTVAILGDRPRSRSWSGPGLPRWLSELDGTRLVQAKYRNEIPRKTSYLLEVEFADGATGTLQARVDHGQGGALTNVWVTDEPLSTIEGVIYSVSRLQPKIYRPIKPASAANDLANALTIGRSADIIVPAPAVNRWPALEPLVEYVLSTWHTR